MRELFCPYQKKAVPLQPQKRDLTKKVQLKTDACGQILTSY